LAGNLHWFSKYYDISVLENYKVWPVVSVGCQHFQVQNVNFAVTFPSAMVFFTVSSHPAPCSVVRIGMRTAMQLVKKY